MVFDSIDPVSNKHNGLRPTHQHLPSPVFPHAAQLRAPCVVHPRRDRAAVSRPPGPVFLRATCTGRPLSLHTVPRELDPLPPSLSPHIGLKEPLSAPPRTFPSSVNPRRLSTSTPSSSTSAAFFAPFHRWSCRASPEKHPRAPLTTPSW
jgi:hypothetical protein